MKIPIPDVGPVAIALDQLDAGDQVRFSGIDLDNGSRVTVTIDREEVNVDAERSHTSSGLVLTLNLLAFKTYR